jgi:hypothetical protein
MKGTTPEGEKAMVAMGFKAVPLTETGAPTPGRIADRLHSHTKLLTDAMTSRNWRAVQMARQELLTLILALDAWDATQLTGTIKEKDDSERDQRRTDTENASGKGADSQGTETPVPETQGATQPGKGQAKKVESTPQKGT